MKLNTLLVINAVVALVYAISLLVIPATLQGVYGIDSNASAQLMARFFGVGLVAVGLLSWLVRNSTDSSTQRAVILALLISYAVGVIVSLLGTLSGVMNAVGWSGVIIYLLLGLGFAYFLFMKPRAA